MVTVRQNRYSVPVALVGLRCSPDRREGDRVCPTTAGHRSSMTGSLGRFGVSAQLDHYLDLLVHKPGALAGSVALHQQREQGDWPGCFDELWAS